MKHMRASAWFRLLLWFVLPAIMPPCLQAGADCSEPLGIADAPKALCRVWLRFHETDLCQGMDAVFVFSKNGMEIWSRVKDKKSYEKLQKLLKSLHDTYHIVLYTTHPSEDTEQDDDWDPPSSLWENYELRSALGDPFARARDRFRLDEMPDRFFPPPDEILRQRLLVYAEQLLERSGKMQSYASGLPALAQVATDPAVIRELRSKAAQISKAHSKKLKNELGKIGKSLKYAFPRSREGKNSFSEQKQPGNTGGTFPDKAEQIAAAAQDVAFRINSFLYPEKHTVDLGELRQPSLLTAIEMLEKMASDFQKAPVNSGRD